jgi:hypothetical protein
LWSTAKPLIYACGNLKELIFAADIAFLRYGFAYRQLLSQGFQTNRAKTYQDADGNLTKK